MLSIKFAQGYVLQGIKNKFRGASNELENKCTSNTNYIHTFDFPLGIFIFRKN